MQDHLIFKDNISVMMKKDKLHRLTDRRQKVFRQICLVRQGQGL